MDFNDTPDQAKFREKCRTWLENNAPYKDGSAKMESFANKDILKEAKAWQKKNMMRVGQCFIGRKNMAVLVQLQLRG